MVDVDESVIFEIDFVYSFGERHQRGGKLNRDRDKKRRKRKMDEEIKKNGEKETKQKEPDID